MNLKLLEERFIFQEDKLKPIQKEKAELFLGRIQPIHLGHKKIIDRMTNPYVGIVKGAESSKDSKKNPLDFNMQVKLLKKVAPNVEVIEVPVGYVPELIRIIRDQGKEVTKVYAGADRIKGYRRQIESLNKKLDDEHKMDVEFLETERVASATDVRKAIRDGDEATYKQLMPKELHGEYETLRKLLGEETVTTTTTTTTAGTPRYDSPQAFIAKNRKRYIERMGYSEGIRNLVTDSTAFAKL